MGALEQVQQQMEEPMVLKDRESVTEVANAPSQQDMQHRCRQACRWHYSVKYLEGALLSESLFNFGRLPLLIRPLIFSVHLTSHTVQ